ncbi:MAG: glycosyltransferase family 4 protein [Deltaproteobacteria bacterium]|nr:glycosyltransferase family 4 protein [Deltaproteobacteria bacterium]
MAELLHLADRVLYQSEFCRFAADHFLGSRTQGAEILYNAVNMSAFKPPASRPAAFTLAICGSHHDPYRLPLAVQTLAVVRRTIRDARLYIAGRASSDQLREVCGLASTAGVADAVDISGPYRQEDAPSVYGAAHVLLHTKYADPCPSVVIEAMGCGLPIVYSKTGGTPELVGEEAGYGVPGELDWYTPRPPSAEDMAEGVCVVAERLKSYSSAARERAVEKFDLKPWLERHRQVFEMLARSS